MQRPWWVARRPPSLRRGTPQETTEEALSKLDNVLNQLTSLDPNEAALISIDDLVAQVTRLYRRDGAGWVVLACHVCVTLL